MNVKVENMQTEIKVKIACECGYIQINKVDQELNFIDCEKCGKELIVDVGIVEFPDVSISDGQL